MESIREQVEREARALGAQALIDPELLEENTALVEWPVAVAGHFDAAFLALPDAVLVATMQGHQRYFPVAHRPPREMPAPGRPPSAFAEAGISRRQALPPAGAGPANADGGEEGGDGAPEGGDGALMPHFIAVSNIESRDVETVRTGNERVIRPRLSDAAYFFDADRRQSLESRLEGLKDVVFQRELGTLHAKAQRVSALAGRVAEAMGRPGNVGKATGRTGGTTADAQALATPTPAAPPAPASPLPAVAGTIGEEGRLRSGRSTGDPDAVAHARRAGLLSKCDLLTEMVGEFPELQGRMGCEYARRDGEPEAVAAAIGEVYLPRFADDAIPATPAGRAVAVADKLDTLAGIFGLGQAPSGDKDPYALRRAALGVLRIIIEAGLDLDLDEMIEAAFEGYAGQDPGTHGGAVRDTGRGIGATAGQAFGAPSNMAETGTGAAAPAGGPAPDTQDSAAREDDPGGTAPFAATHPPGAAADLRRFMIERLRVYFADRSIPADVFNAVLAKQPARPLDFAHRVRAVEAFRALPEAASLAAANKRIRNILRQAEQAGIDIPPVGFPPPAFPASAEPDPGSNGGMTADDALSRGGAGAAGIFGSAVVGAVGATGGVPGDADASLLREDAERSLAARLAEIEPQARGMLDAGEYTAALACLAGLRDGVDAFFDTVKVMDDDETLRGNRLALLARIGALFMETADISLLQPASE